MNVRSPDSDETLFQQLVEGDARALDELFRRHYTDLCRVANRFVQREATAEDLVQDFFASIWEKRESLVKPEAVGPYLRRSVRNRSLNFLRDQKRIPVNDGEVPVTMAAPLAVSGIETAELRTRINTAINQLPERCRLVFTMSKLDEMSHREIAQSLGISTKTVENQMTRAYRSLREWLALFILFYLII